MLNPYVVVFANRTSMTLLAYAALPWLLLAAHRGVRSPRALWWPAAFALLVAAAGGGVNAARDRLARCSAPLLLLLYEPLHRRASSWRDARALRLAHRRASRSWPRCGGSLPVLVQARYGVDFLQFTEQPGTIWRPPA